MGSLAGVGEPWPVRQDVGRAPPAERGGSVPARRPWRGRSPGGVPRAVPGGDPL